MLFNIFPKKYIILLSNKCRKIYKINSNSLKNTNKSFYQARNRKKRFSIKQKYKLSSSDKTYLPIGKKEGKQMEEGTKGGKEDGRRERRKGSRWGGGREGERNKEKRVATIQLHTL